MVKLLKILGRTFGVLFEWILICIIVLAFAIRTSPVQTYFAKKATEYLSKELNTTVKIDQVAITFFDQVALDGFLILDLKGDTLLAAKTVFATLDDYDLGKSYFKIGKVQLDEGYGHIQIDEKGESNLKFLVDYFKSDKPKEPTSVELAITTVDLNDTHFKFDDHRKKRLERGVDFAHIDASEITGSFTDISIVGSDISTSIVELTAKEKAGFYLKNLTSEAKVGPTGIYLSALEMDSDKSSVRAPKLNLITNDFGDYAQFVDSVTFDVQLAESQVSMLDVALFARALDGMDETVRVKGEASKKVKDLKLSNLDVRIKKKTRIRGTINLPDFADIKKAFFHEKLDYVYVDLNEIEKVRLPNSSSRRYLSMEEHVDRLGYFEAKDVRLDGFYSEFVLSSDIVNTQLGSVRLNNGIQFIENPRNNSFLFSKSLASEYDVKVESFDLGKFLANSSFGIVDGTFSLSGEAFSPSKIDFNLIEGDVNRFEYLGYAYQAINIQNGSFKNNIFDGIVTVQDDNLNLVYDGFIDFNGTQQMVFTADLGKAFLQRLGFTDQDSRLSSKFRFELSGSNANNISGTIGVDGLIYTEDGKEISVPNFDLTISRSEAVDIFDVKSNIADARLEGKVDFNNLWDDLNYQISRIFPALYLYEQKNIRDRDLPEDRFEFDVTIKNDISDFLAIFAPKLEIEPGSTLNGNYDGLKSSFLLNLNSKEITYDKFEFQNVSINQVMDSISLLAAYNVKTLRYHDTLTFNDLSFGTSGGRNELTSDLKWDFGTPYASHIKWETSVRDNDHFNFTLNPSYFSIQGNQWSIANASQIRIDNDTVYVGNFKVQHENQYVSLDGVVSNQDKHKLNYEVRDIDLGDLSSLLVDGVDLQGKLNSWGYLSNHKKNITFVGDAHLLAFKVDNQDIGDIFAHSEWDNTNQSIKLNGDLMYKGLQTFDFEGNYFVKKEENNLQFDLTFDKTDISFANAFMDPDVVKDISGLLNGRIALRGSPSNPVLNGTVELDNAKANVALLGAKFGLEGPIVIDKYGFYINGIPIFDEEGNAGSLVGSVYHENFTEFNFDLLFDLEEDAIKRDPIQPWVHLPLDRFLVMNSKYAPDVLYYGKAYVTGVANIFGYVDNLEVTVDLKTEKGTDVNFPMYGVGEIEAEHDYIAFKKDSSDVDGKTERKIDFTGVDLDLHFDITKDASVKIIFDENVGDIISATGTGDMTIKLDNLGDITMDGTYTIANGVYDFAMGPIKEKFFIEPGGNIAWTGNPYDAQLNLRTYNKVNANIAELSSDQFSGSSSAHEEILCYLTVKETLLKPAIGFDIAAPRANEAGQSLINRVKSDNDELNRQFFSLMLWKRFQPLTGELSASGGAALDLITNQINSLLAKVSSDYKMNVNVDNDQITGDNSFEFGLKKGFLDDRLIVSGSFGVESSKAGSEGAAGGIIGDVNLEYLLNQSGTFRVQIFNESNDKTVIQDQSRGHFTQGAGLNYQEDFNSVQDFRAIQSFLDIFRKKENKRYPIKRNKRQVAIPPKEGEDPIETSKQNQP